MIIKINGKYESISADKLEPGMTFTVIYPHDKFLDQKEMAHLLNIAYEDGKLNTVNNELNTGWRK